MTTIKQSFGPQGIDALEQQSVYMLREAYRHYERLCMLWSIGKDSTVMSWLARKAFFGYVPFPLVHIDEGYELTEMLEYRDKLAKDWHLRLLIGRNDQAIAEGLTFPATMHLPDDDPKKVTRFQCCSRLKSEALKRTLDGSMPRKRFDHATVYRDLRAGAESGWDFSSRWQSDPRDIATIRTTSIVPVDLNCFLMAGA